MEKLAALGTLTVLVEEVRRVEKFSASVGAVDVKSVQDLFLPKI